jgi:hypothetical protein
MSLHREISFENEICDSLAAGGWLRVYDIITPYVDVKNDARLGGRLDADV